MFYAIIYDIRYKISMQLNSKFIGVLLWFWSVDLNLKNIIFLVECEIIFLVDKIILYILKR